MVNRSGYNPQSHRYAPFRIPYRSAYNGMDVRRGTPAFPQVYDPHRVMRGGDGDVPEESTTNRKRIAVACGRCRKRKIRCSGDNGNGEPCANCRSSGSSPCQFLRVSSLETNLKDNPRGFQTFSYDAENPGSYQPRVEEEAMGVAPPTSQGLAHLPPMYQDTMHPGWGQVSYDPNPYRTVPPFSGGISSLNRAYPWNSGGCYDSASDQNDSPSPSATHYGSMFPQAQDPRYQMATYQMAPPMKQLPYIEADPNAYSMAGQPTAISTTATLVSRYGAVESGSNFPMHDMPHGLMSSPAMEKYPAMDSNEPHTPDQIVGAKIEPFGSMSTYSKSSPSPASSLACLTPSPSYGSYTASPALAFPAVVTVTQKPRSTFPPMDGYNGLAAVATPLSSHFPPPATHSYTYADMSAQAPGVVASGQRLSPTEQTAQLAQFQAQQSCFTSDGLSEIERKPPTMPH